MDVKALFPNCKGQGTQQAVKESFNTCGLGFDNVDVKFLTKFVSLLTRGHTGNNRLNQFIQVPNNRTTLTSWLRRKSESQFRGPPARPAEELTNEDINRLIGIA